MTAGYFWALRRFPAPGWRIACWLGAMVLILAVTITPVETISVGFLLSVHLIQNVVLAEQAPLLAVLAIPPALAARAPTCRRSRRSRSGSSTAGSGTRTCPGSTTPRSATLTPCSTSSTPSTSSPASRSVARRPRCAGGGREGRIRLRCVPAREPDRPADGARTRSDLRLLRRGAAALGPVPDPRPADRRVSMAAAEAIVFFAVFAFFFARFFAEQDVAT